MRRLTVILAVALAAGGCGSSAPTGSPASAVSAAAPTHSAIPPSSQPPKVWTAAQARTRYLAMVAPYNKSLEAFRDAAHAQKPWQELRPLAADMARACAAHAKALRAGRWPMSMRAVALDLAAETEIAGRAWQRAASAQTAAKLADAVKEAARHDGGEQAGRIRTLLGLPQYTKS